MVNLGTEACGAAHKVNQQPNAALGVHAFYRCQKSCKRSARHIDLVARFQGIWVRIVYVSGTTLLKNVDQPVGQLAWPARDIAHQPRNAACAADLGPVWLRYVKLYEDIAGKHRAQNTLWAFFAALCFPKQGSKRVEALPLQIYQRQTIAIWAQLCSIPCRLRRDVLHRNRKRALRVLFHSAPPPRPPKGAFDRGALTKTTLTRCFAARTRAR